MTFLDRTFVEEVIARAALVPMPELRRLAEYLSDQVSMSDMPDKVSQDSVLAKWLPGNWHVTGWVAPDNLEPEAYFQIGEVLGLVEQARGWWWGDYIRYGDGRYGEMYAQAVDLAGVAYSTLAHYVNVAKRFEFARRQQQLTFSHHAVVARDYLTPKVQDDLLWQAIEENLTVSDLDALRDEIRREQIRQAAILEMEEAGQIVDVGPEETEETEISESSEFSDNSTSLLVQVVKERDGEIVELCYELPFPVPAAYAVGNPQRVDNQNLICPHCGESLVKRE